jgi:3-hydroxyisobutyrate dehydrogenase
MGAPIAHNFVSAGQPLVVKDENPRAQERFLADHPTAAGASTLDDFAECEIVVLVLPNSDIVGNVVLSDHGLLTYLRPGSTLVDMGSSVPARTQALARAANHRNVTVVDAPVSGGVTRAWAADLAVMVGGERHHYVSVLPLLRTTGTRIIHVGTIGSGHAAKALNNMLSATGLVAAAEVLLVGRKFGIDPSILLSVINASSGRNQATETKYEEFILSRTYAAGFSAQLMRKDIGIALDLAQTEGVEVALGVALGKLWRSAVESLEPGADHTEVVRYLEELTGVSLDSAAMGATPHQAAQH